MGRSFIGSLFFLFSFSGYAQEAKFSMIGPKAKNYKVWKHTIENSQIYINEEAASKGIGPDAKNSRMFDKIANKNLKQVEILDSRRVKVKGPAAKNARHSLLN